MSSSALVAKKFAVQEYAWKLVIVFLRQQPKAAGEYHIIRTDEVSAGVEPDYEQLQQVVRRANRAWIHVVDPEEDEHTFMPLFHSIGRRAIADGNNVVARFNTPADAELHLLRQGLTQFAADVIPTAKQLNAAIRSEGVILTVKMDRQ